MVLKRPTTKSGGMWKFSILRTFKPLKLQEHHHVNGYSEAKHCFLRSLSYWSHKTPESNMSLLA